MILSNWIFVSALRCRLLLLTVVDIVLVVNLRSSCVCRILAVIVPEASSLLEVIFPSTIKSKLSCVLFWNTTFPLPSARNSKSLFDSVVSIELFRNLILLSWTAESVTKFSVVLKGPLFV